jgi:hypothetical protein
MNNNKQTIAAIGIAMVLVLSTLVGGFATTTATATTVEDVPDETVTSSDIVETQETAVEFVTQDLQQVGDVEFTSRHGPVATIQPNDVAVLLADCNTGEFAVAGQNIFESIQVEQSSSFSIGFEDLNLMSWLIVAENTHDSSAKDAAAGVTCADELGDGDDDSNNVNTLDVTVRTALQNAVNQYIIKGGDVDIDITNLVNIVQNITQVVNVVNNITGNNNTVINVINQTAQNVANINASQVNVGQIINQTAQNVVEQTGNQSAIQEVEQQIETPDIPDNSTAGLITSDETTTTPPVVEEEEPAAVTPPTEEETQTETPAEVPTEEETEVEEEETTNTTPEEPEVNEEETTTEEPETTEETEEVTTEPTTTTEETTTEEEEDPQQ